MQKAIIGKKVGMTQIFDEAGHVIPVTVIEAGPCVVAQKKTIENDGYVSVQLAFGDVAEKKLSKPELGHLKRQAFLPRSTSRNSSLIMRLTSKSALRSRLTLLWLAITLT